MRKHGNAGNMACISYLCAHARAARTVILSCRSHTSYMAYRSSDQSSSVKQAYRKRAASTDLVMNVDQFILYMVSSFLYYRTGIVVQKHINIEHVQTYNFVAPTRCMARHGAHVQIVIIDRRMKTKIMRGMAASAAAAAYSAGAWRRTWLIDDIADAIFSSACIFYLSYLPDGTARMKRLNLCIYAARAWACTSFCCFFCRTPVHPRRIGILVHGVHGVHLGVHGVQWRGVAAYMIGTVIHVHASTRAASTFVGCQWRRRRARAGGRAAILLFAIFAVHRRLVWRSSSSSMLSSRSFVHLEYTTMIVIVHKTRGTCDEQDLLSSILP